MCDEGPWNGSDVEGCTDFMLVYRFDALSGGFCIPGILLNGFEPLSPGSKPGMIDHYTTGVKEGDD